MLARFLKDLKGKEDLLTTLGKYVFNRKYDIMIKL